MDKVKEQTLASEIIAKQKKIVNDILTEIDLTDADLEKAKFILSELAEMTDTEPQNEREAALFAYNQPDIVMKVQIARDYVVQVQNTLADIVMKRWRQQEDSE